MRSNSAKQSLFLLCYMAGMLLLAGFVQSQLFINHDVAWLLEVSRRLLGGGTYAKDFFENNPPLILYLYLLPVLMTKYFSLNIILSLRLYVLMIATLSLFISYGLIDRIFKKHVALGQVFFGVVGFLLLILPYYDFGQREHLLMLFSMPYFLLASYRLQGGFVSEKSALLIGLMAGIGFAIKPYFLLIPLLVEVYYSCARRNLFSFARSEVYAMVLVFFAYLLAVLLLNPDYLFLVMPYALRWCYQGSGLPTIMLLGSAQVSYIFSVIIFYLIQNQHGAYRELRNVLFFAMLGCVGSFLLQHVVFSYHFFPALSLGILISLMLFAMLIIYPVINRLTLLLLSLFAILEWLFYFSVNYTLPILIFNPLIFFAYFSLVFAFVLYFMAHPKREYKWYIVIAMTVLVSVCGYVFTNILKMTEWYPHRLLLTTIFIGLLYSVVAYEMSNKKSHILLLFSLGISIFLFPATSMYGSYSNADLPKVGLTGYVDYVNTNFSHQSIYIFSSGNYAFPYVGNYTSATSVSRFSSFWMLGALVKHAYIQPYSAQRTKDKNFLIDMIADDLREKKPDAVFVDVQPVKGNLFYVRKLFTKYYRQVIPFDYIRYFSKNKNFVEVWKAYHYKETLKVDAKPLFDVYVRDEKS